MKIKPVFALLLILLLSACEKMVDDRIVSTQFFPANAVYVENAQLKFSDTVKVYSIYTGNDTVAFGKPCVIRWTDGANLPLGRPNTPVMAFIHEDAGKVYTHAGPEYAHLSQGWTLLYDFSIHPWKVGDEIMWNKTGEPYIAPIVKLETMTLCNGEKVQVAEDPSGYRLIYGIGYEGCTFFGVAPGMLPQDGTRNVPISFYRNGELLWHHSQYAGAHD